MKIILIALLLVAGCASVPKQYEDERVIVLEGRAWVKDADTKTAAEIDAIASDYTVPVLDEAERKACNRVLWGQGADLVTTGVGLALGCTEANPLYAGNIGAVVVVKVYMMAVCREQARRTPKAFSMAKMHNWSAGIGAGAAIWNITQLGSCQ